VGARVKRASDLGGELGAQNSEMYNRTQKNWRGRGNTSVLPGSPDGGIREQPFGMEHCVAGRSKAALSGQ